MCFDNDIPISIMDNGFEPGAIFYNNKGQRIGELLATGRIKHDNLFKKDTSALLMGKVPVAELEQVGPVLNLLIQDVVTEDTVNLLYDSSDCPQKTIWIRRKIADFVIRSNKQLTPSAIESIVANDNFESVMKMLASCSNSHNAKVIFNEIMNNTGFRQQLLRGDCRESFFTFLTKQGDISIFSEYLIVNQDKPWFEQGLMQFAVYATEKNKNHFLCKALERIVADLNANKVTTEQYDSVLKALVRSKVSTQIMMRGFLGDDELGMIQTSSNLTIQSVLSFFDKKHIVDVINSLNGDNNWQSNAQYRFLLMLFNSEHERIFPHQELRLSASQAWQYDELKSLSTFVKRHLATPLKIDKKNKIGRYLLGEMAFRCANFGITELFYNDNGAINQKVAKSHIKRSYLASFISRVYLLDHISQTIKSAYNSIKSWLFNEEETTVEELELLKDNGYLIDWKALTKEAWAFNGGEKMPILIAYLMNYSGKSNNLTQLLDDLFALPILNRNVALIEKLSAIMTKFPNRDVSRVIYLKLEKMLIARPALLTKKTFVNMAEFYSFSNKRTIYRQGSMQNKMNLIGHFGQQKHYSLTHKCCNILSRLITYDHERRRVKKIAVESKTEASLQKYTNSWYFGVVRLLKRLWNYRFSTPTGFIKFCDDNNAYHETLLVPAIIQTKALCGHEVSKKINYVNKLREFKEKHSQFIQGIKEGDGNTPVPPKKNDVGKLPEQRELSSRPLLIDNIVKNSLFSPGASDLNAGEARLIVGVS